MNKNMQKNDSTLNLTLFAEDVTRLHFPAELSSKVSRHTDTDDRYVDLVENDTMERVHLALRQVIRLLPGLGGDHRHLSIMKYAERVCPNRDVLILTPDEVRILAEQQTILEYAYYSRFARETRFRDTESFFLVTFPQGATESLPDIAGAPTDIYGGSSFMLTIDMNLLDDFLHACGQAKTMAPTVRIDYFSVGSFMGWYVWPDTLESVAALHAGLELHIHPAMLTDKDDAIYPLSRHILRSRIWRRHLCPEL